MVIVTFPAAGSILGPFRGAFRRRFDPSAGWFAPGANGSLPGGGGSRAIAHRDIRLAMKVEIYLTLFT